MLIVTITLPTMLVGACGLGEPNESERYRDSIVVEGYKMVRGDFSDAAFGIYLGQSQDDLTLASKISGPGELRVARGTTDKSRGTGFIFIGEGVGYLDGKIRCGVNVQRLSSDTSTVTYVGTDLLTDAEIKGIEDGSKVVVEVNVLCAPQSRG